MKPLNHRELQHNFRRIVRRFQHEGATAEPVFFGAYGHRTGVLISYQRYEALSSLTASLLELQALSPTASEES